MSFISYPSVSRREIEEVFNSINSLIEVKGRFVNLIQGTVYIQNWNRNNFNLFPFVVPVACELFMVTGNAVFNNSNYNNSMRFRLVRTANNSSDVVYNEILDAQSSIGANKYQSIDILESPVSLAAGDSLRLSLSKNEDNSTATKIETSYFLRLK